MRKICGKLTWNVIQSCENVPKLVVKLKKTLEKAMYSEKVENINFYENVNVWLSVVNHRLETNNLVFVSFYCQHREYLIYVSNPVPHRGGVPVPQIQNGSSRKNSGLRPNALPLRDLYQKSPLGESTQLFRYWSDSLELWRAPGVLLPDIWKKVSDFFSAHKK